MKKLLLTIILAVSIPAHAHGHHGGGGGWFGPMLGGMIIGGVLVDAMRPAPPPNTVIIQQPPVVVQPNYHVVPVQPTCRYENAYSASGQWIGQIQICN